MDFASQAMLFGAGLLVSRLPFVILPSAFASQRIDDDISPRLGSGGGESRLALTSCTGSRCGSHPGWVMFWFSPAGLIQGQRLGRGQAWA